MHLSLIFAKKFVKTIREVFDTAFDFGGDLLAVFEHGVDGNHIGNRRYRIFLCSHNFFAKLLLNFSLKTIPVFDVVFELHFHVGDFFL
jgi:hypothetical protein